MMTDFFKFIIINIFIFISWFIYFYGIFSILFRNVCMLLLFLGLLLQIYNFQNGFLILIKAACFILKHNGSLAVGWVWTLIGWYLGEALTSLRSCDMAMDYVGLGTGFGVC